jgi:hypothetical protein
VNRCADRNGGLAAVAELHGLSGSGSLLNSGSRSLGLAGCLGGSGGSLLGGGLGVAWL